MSVAGVRGEVALALASTSLAVFDHLAQLGNVGKPSALVGVQRGERRDIGCGTQATLTVWVVAAQIDPGPSDDELDAALDEVLTALDAAEGIVWRTYERGVYGEANPAYQVTVEVATDDG